MSTGPQLHSLALPGFHGSDGSLTYKISCKPFSTSNSWTLGPFPSPTQVFHVCKMLSNCLCAKALHRRRTFHRVLSCHHCDRGAGKIHGWDTNTLQPRSLGQIQDAFSSCSLKGMKTTQLVYTIKAPVTTALLYQLSHVRWFFKSHLRSPSPCHPSAPHASFSLLLLLN